MWCDDFDMDLPKVVPGAREALGDLADFELFTHGHETDGKLNHPNVWNHPLGSVAFFGRDHPHKPDSYVTSSPIVRCTLWEAIRDAWCHNIVILFETAEVIYNSERSWPLFEKLMWHIRGWRTLPDSEVEGLQVDALTEIRCCKMLLERAVIVGSGFSPTERGTDDLIFENLPG